ncbi:U11/U12 small nuclear ribonucleoprotein 25 kDa protein-like isoform X2 [Nilaparvata lugens]|nr:U11/U12 small nuclear ribonucleoprotein 25 kDa protein-like isoform X2 [Nilaparvata lugens]XP_039296006.1 U11/U12 small nuclear ribonucleoprotein 25 kDa protein-like isoform X2 [Nilaparvata lugens]
MDASTSKTLTTAHTSETVPTAHTSETVRTAHTSETVPTAQAQQLNQDSGAAELSHEAHAQPLSQDGGAAELSHEELMEVTSTALNDLLKTVTILADLPQDVTLEEVNAQIAVQHGQSITVYAVREDGEEIAAVVNQKGARVIDLKHAIRRAVDLKLKRTGKIGKVSEKRKISWKYVWKTNHLSFDGEQLSNDQALLSEMGIRNKSRVTFVKRLRAKGTVKRSVIKSNHIHSLINTCNSINLFIH